MIQGPHVKKLIIYRLSSEMVPPGTTVFDVIEAIKTPGRISQEAKKAMEWVDQAIQAVRSAPDNSYTTDEEIAGEILRRIEERKRE